jgi:hypothetical protein
MKASAVALWQRAEDWGQAAFPPVDLDRRRLSPLKSLLLFGILAGVFSLLGLFISPGGFIGFDWYSFFGVGNIPPFYPPWTPWVTSALSWPLLIGLSMAAYGLACLRRSAHPLSLAAACLCLPFLWTLFLGQLEGIVLLGILGLPWLAPLALLKPQLALFACLAKPRYLLAGLLVLVVSFLIFGPWWSSMLNAEAYHAEGRFAQNIALGLWAWASRGDVDMLMLSGAFITPYLIPYNLMPLSPALARLRPHSALLGLVFSWLPLVCANAFGPWGWWTGWLFPLWLWANLAARRYPGFKIAGWMNHYFG